MGNEKNINSRIREIKRSIINSSGKPNTYSSVFLDIVNNNISMFNAYLRQHIKQDCTKKHIDHSKV